MITFLKSVLTTKYLTEVPSGGMYHALLAFVVFGLSILLSIVLYFFARQQKIKFQRTFYKRLADGFLYVPILLILYVFLRYMQIGIATQRIFFLLLFLIWLIWLLYLVYYRLVAIPELVVIYKKKKTDERYIRNGKGTK